MSGIPAHIDWQTTDFSFPTNFPFQAYAARYPVPVRAGVGVGVGRLHASEQRFPHSDPPWPPLFYDLCVPLSPPLTLPPTHPGLDRINLRQHQL